MSEAEREELLEHYLRLALQRIEAGETVHATGLCREHPELAPALAEALGLADELSVLQGEALLGDPLAGRVLGGRYRLEACLGRGAMGVVYRAIDQELQRPVAVKILDARLFADPTSEQRFLREAEMLAALQHDHVVAVHDRGRTGEGILFLVMEQLHGCALSTVLGRLDGKSEPLAAAADLLQGRPPETSWVRLCARWAADLAAGLSAVHDQGITHRDLKPSNVFVRRDFRPVLLDFGIAARAEDARLTATATSLGTPSYMAPEQAGGGAAGPAVDVYGLGATLYHLLAGRPPYEGDPAAVLVALQTRDPTPLQRLRPEVPRDLQAIVDKAMERDPRRRYRDAAAMEADLRAFLDHRPVSVRPLSWAGRRWRAVRRAPARAVAVSALTLAAVSIAIAVPVWAGEAERARRREKQELLDSLPALLAVEGQPQQRLLESLDGETRRDLQVLDRILELDPGDPVRLFRAALRQDLGDHQGAAADLAYLAEQEGSPYLRELARRYQQAEGDRRGTEAVPIDGLPEPQSVQDHFVAGFHELRNRHRSGFAERAVAHLTAAGDYPPARDLLLIANAALADLQTDRAAREALFQKVYDDSLLLEGSYGRPTARLLAMRGVALIGRKRYDEAIAPLEQSLRLRPDRHGPHQNLGVALRRLGRLDEAEAHLQKAEALRPHFWNTPYTLAQVQRDRGEFEAAYATADRARQDLPEAMAWRGPDLVANIALAEALAYRDREPDRARAALQRAAEAFDQALALARSRGQRARLQVRRQVAAALLEQDLDAATQAFLELLLAAPDDPYQIANLAAMLPAGGLGPRATWLLGLYLRSLARSMATGDPRLRDRMQAEFDDAARRGPPR